MGSFLVNGVFSSLDCCAIINVEGEEGVYGNSDWNL